MKTHTFLLALILAFSVAHAADQKKRAAPVKRSDALSSEQTTGSSKPQPLPGIMVLDGSATEETTRTPESAEYAQPKDEPSDKIRLRFDGLYQAQMKDGDYSYLRFFEDGMVKVVGTGGTPEQIAKWLTREHAHSGTGTFAITGTRIRFTSDSRSGRVDYDGWIKDDSIELNWYSHINQRRGAYQYKFVQVEFTPLAASQVGLDPVPDFESAEIKATVQQQVIECPDLGTVEQYVYNYSVFNPASNTGEVWYIKVDISQPKKTDDEPCDATLPRGRNPVLFRDYYQTFEPFLRRVGHSVVPVGQRVPPGWAGGFGVDGFLGFASATGTPNILPGQGISGLQLISRRPPVLRAAQVIADWVHLVENHDAVTDQERAQAALVEQKMRYRTVTLGPSGYPQQGSSEHWQQLHDDLNRMINDLQWIEPALGATLRTQLDSARAGFDTGNRPLTRQRLEILLTTLERATTTQLRSEARALIELNARSLIESMSTKRD